MKLTDRSDRIKHTLQWVWGACVLWNQQMKQFSDINHQEFQSFVHRTHNVVFRYLNDRQTLDGTCSDFECHTAMEAKKVFGMFTTMEDNKRTLAELMRDNQDSDGDVFLMSMPLEEDRALDQLKEPLSIGQQEDLIGSFWTMLKECESVARNDDDRLLKHQVKCWFRQWNELTGQTHNPAWME